MNGQRADDDPLTQTGKWRAVDAEADALSRRAEASRRAIGETVERIARGVGAYGSVLVVDDYDLMRKTLSYVLRDFDVRVCATAEEALRVVVGELALGGCRIDVVIIDLDLPGIDGVELAQRLRRDLPRAGLIMVSGIMDRLKRAAREAGVDAYFGKPFDVEAVRQKVEELVERPSRPGDPPQSGVGR